MYKKGLSVLMMVCCCSLAIGQSIEAEWLFNSDANDNSGNSLDGTVVGATWATGQMEDGLSLDQTGSIQYVRIADNGLDNVIDNAISISFWIKPLSGVNSYPRIMYKDGNFDLCVHSSSNINFTAKQWASPGLWQSAHFSMDINEWQHWVVTYCNPPIYGGLPT